MRQNMEEDNFGFGETKTVVDVDCFISTEDIYWTGSIDMKGLAGLMMRIFL